METALALSEMQEIVRAAKGRLKEMDDHSLEICKGFAGYVQRLSRYWDEIEDEKAMLEKHVAYYEPIINRLISEDMAL